MLLHWAGLAVFFVALVLLDLQVLNRARRRMTPLSGLGWASFYLLLAGIFNALVYVLYDHHWMGLGMQGVEVALGPADASLQFLSTLLLELALDIDTVFVISAIFLHFGTPDRAQHRVLFWGILLALCIRAGMIGTVGGLLHAFDWVKFVLSGFLVLAALRMLIIRRDAVDPDSNLLVRALRRFVPVTNKVKGSNLFARVNGRMALTPLLITLILLETADGVFALDSIPATFALTRDPLLVFAANGFALLCLRSLYFALTGFTGWLRFMKVGLAIILAYAAVVMSLPVHHRMPTGVSLLVIAGALAAAALVSFIFRRPGPTPTTSPLGEDAERIARITLKQARKVIIFVVGLTVVLVGVVMLVGPGPGLLVIPIGLALLASEFIWAKRWLNQYTVRAGSVIQRSSNILIKKPRPYLIIPVFILTATALILVLTLSPWPAKFIWPVATPLLIFIGIWAVTTLMKHHELTRPAEPVDGAPTRPDEPEPREAPRP